MSQVVIICGVQYSGVAQLVESRHGGINQPHKSQRDILYFTYILFSKTSQKYYCGQTGNLEKRILQHNDLNYRGSLTTKRIKGPWELVWFEKHTTRSEAIMQERIIKKRGISRYLKEHL